MIVGHELGARLDVDELRAGRLGVRQQPLALLFRPLEAASFPRGAARDDNRAPPALERADRVGTIDRVEAHLDQVGERRARRARGAAPPSFGP